MFTKKIDVKKVGERIAELRKKCALTGEKFAELLDVSPQAVSKWENGKNLPETALLPGIAQILDASIDFLLMPIPHEHLIHPKKKVAAYTGARYHHANAYPALFAAVALFFGQEARLNEKQEQINDDVNYHLQTALSSEAYGVQYSELFETDCLQYCLGLYGIKPRVIDCTDMTERQVRELVCTTISQNTPIIIEPTAYTDILFAFGYKEMGKALCCCTFLDGDDEKNCAYNFTDHSLLHNRTANVRRLIVLEESGDKLEPAAVYDQSLKRGVQMMMYPSARMNFAELKGAGSGIYNAWIALLQKANEENSQQFYMEFPVFPQLIILFDNRFHLNKFLIMYAEIVDKGQQQRLLQAQKKCEELVHLAMQAAEISVGKEYLGRDTQAMTNNERRSLIIVLLQQCCKVEQAMVEWLSPYWHAERI